MYKFICLVFITILLITAGPALSCTIGVAAPVATSNGRAMLWKTRDIGTYPSNYLEYSQTSEHSFIYVRDQRDSLAWMGANDKGLCVANSYVQRRETGRPIFNNGLLIYYLLEKCATIAEVDAFLDTLDISSQVLSGNFGIIDSTGAAAIYEISWTQVSKYDAGESENGFVIRTNFSYLSGGDEGIERFTRSQEIITDLYSQNNLNASALMQHHFRDFSDDNSQQVNVPYYDRWFLDRPWGYIKTNDSICRGIAASSAVFESVLPGEPAYTTTMYALLGNPATSVYLPCFPVADPPHQATPLTGLQLTTSANQLKELLFDLPDNSYYLDSFDLLEPGSIRIFDRILPFDELMYDNTAEFLLEWRSGNASLDEAVLHSQYWADQAVILHQELPMLLSNELIPDFDVNINTGPAPLVVTFNDQTPHFPTDIQWDFDNDGNTDVVDTYTPLWTYTQPGIYSVKMTVSNTGGSQEIIKENLIEVTQTDVQTNELLPKPRLFATSPNPLISSQRSANIEISFYIPQTSSNIKIDVFNFRGQKIATRSYQDSLQAGRHTWQFNTHDSTGNPLPVGIYLYRIQIPGYKNLFSKFTIIR